MNGDSEMVTQYRMCVQGAEEGCQEERTPQEEWWTKQKGHPRTMTWYYS